MDVKVHLAVLARFKLLIAAGFVLAVLLAILSVAKLQFNRFPPLAYRGHELWMSHETLLVTQTGFPIGQSVYNEVLPVRQGNTPITGPESSYVQRFADTGRFATLAALYARLANSDQVERLLLKHHPVRGGVSISASAVTDSQVGPLPLVQVTGMGISRSAASAMARNASDALRQYISNEQTANSVPATSRVVLATVKRAGSTGPIEDSLGGTTLVSGHSKLKPMAVFIAVFGLFVAIAYILENLRPRIRLVKPAAEAEERRRNRPAA
jgi:hypothetical protein